MFYRIKRTQVWLRRFFHLKGNGVQSPFAYSFICEVISNTTPYYAYSDHKAQLKAMSLRQRKHAKLLFRLANWSQAHTIWLPQHMQHYTPLLTAGRQQAIIHTYTHHSQLPTSATHTNLIIIDATQVPLEHLPSDMPDKTTYVLLNIRHTKAPHTQWRQLAATIPAALTFDLYDTGLILIRPKYVKQHYIVNY